MFPILSEMPEFAWGTTLISKRIEALAVSALNDEFSRGALDLLDSIGQGEFPVWSRNRIVRQEPLLDHEIHQWFRNLIIVEAEAEYLVTACPSLGVEPPRQLQLVFSFE